MGRAVRRVPLDFDWPLSEVWDGFLLPKRLSEKKCPDCKNGYSPEAQHLQDRWYGQVPFDPAETGSTPFTIATPEVRAFAERNVARAPECYGTGAVAVEREANRLLKIWNNCWMHHLAQQDVDTLVEEGRLMDFTWQWDAETGRRIKIDPPPTVTAEEVNRWSLVGFGHDSLNCGYVIRAECERRGVAEICPTCAGHSSLERWPGQRAEAEAWEPIDPPTGVGWQLWETTSEGSPKTPVFTTPEELAEYCAEHVSIFGDQMGTRDRWLAIVKGEDFAHVEIAPGMIAL